MLNQILLGDCYELMKDIPDGSIDAVISDFPYNTTQAEWDKDLIDLPLLWQHLNRILKHNGCVVTTASQPFTTKLIISNFSCFKYCLVWDKGKVTGHLDANRRPLKAHEDICIFNKSKATYNPQKVKGGGLHLARPFGRRLRPNETYNEFGDFRTNIYSDEYFPRSIISITADLIPEHPNQKPVALFEYLIRTYTNPGETVLDPFAGSGTTAIAAHNTGRQFICFEKEQKYWQIANKRLELVRMQGRFDEMVG